MLHRLPKDTPPWADLIADIGNPSASKIARALGVSTRTVERWNKAGAPRTATLAVWWLSQYGYAFLDRMWADEHRKTRAHNRLLLAQVNRLGNQHRGGHLLEEQNASRPAANDCPPRSYSRPVGPVPAKAVQLHYQRERHLGGAAAARNKQRASVNGPKYGLEEEVAQLDLA